MNAPANHPPNPRIRSIRSRPRKLYSQQSGTEPRRALLSLLSIGSLSYAVLVFEVALTRIFSLLLNYHYVFAILSGAVAGLGIGAMAINYRVSISRKPAVTSAAMLFAVLLAASVLIIARLPPLGTWTWPVFLLLATLPFIAAGFAIAGILQQFPSRIPMLYGADLMGAACGALSAIALMDAVGPINTVLVAAAVAGIGALGLEASRVRMPLVSGGVFLGLTALLLSVMRHGVEVRLPVTNDPDKEMLFLLSDPALKTKILETRWSSFGRTDVVGTELAPHQRMLFVDGGAGSLMYDLKAVLKNPKNLATITTQYGGFFPLPLLKDDEKSTALIVGLGGGKDTLAARLGGVKEITAVEVNPDVVDILRDYESFNGGVGTGRFGVTTVVGEGRAFLRNTNVRYDLILSAIPVTKSSRSVDGYALTENYLFTAEAFTDYLRHLSPNGRIILVAHNEMEIYRLISLAMAAFQKQGISEQEVMKRLYTVPAPLLPTLVVQKRPLTPEDAAAVDERLRRLRFDERPSYVPYRKHVLAERDEYIPDQQKPVVDERLTSVAEGRATLATVADSASYDISAVSDDRPFFYDLERGLPDPLGKCVGAMVALVAGLALLVGLRNPAGGNPTTFTSVLMSEPVLKRLASLCFLLGVGYMLVEIALFRKLMLFIGQPQRALTVLLFSLLLGGGLGSMFSSSLTHQIGKVGTWMSLGIGVAAVLLSQFSSALFALGVSPLITAVCCLVPLGFMMGFPFPIAMRLVSAHEFTRFVSALWGINAIASVLGSLLCMVVALWFGFSWALLLGGTTYLLSAVVFFGIPELRFELRGGYTGTLGASDAASEYPSAS